MLKIYVLAPCYGCITFYKKYFCFRSFYFCKSSKTLINAILGAYLKTFKSKKRFASKFVVNKANGVNPKKLLEFKI